MSGQSTNTNIFGSASTSAAGTLASSPVIWGSSLGSMSSSSNGFGSGGGFGQCINSKWSSTGSSGSQYTFGQRSNGFGSAPNNDGTSSGVFGGFSFGQSSNLFGSVPNNGGTSTGIFGQTESNSSFDQSSNIFGHVLNNGGTSSGIFGQPASSSSFGQRSSIFGSVPNNGGTSMGLFGTSASSSPFIFQHTFGSVPANGGTSMGVLGATVSSASVATSSSPILWSSSTRSSTISQVSASIASNSPGFGSNCMTSSGQASVPWYRSSLSGTSTFSFGTHSSFSGNQVRAPTFRLSESDKSNFGEKRGSTVTSYTKTTTKDDKGERKYLVSISAMPAYQNKSHEELRWEDHHQYNAGGGGAVPASVQSNDYRNSIARTDDTFPSPIHPSVSSNLFPRIVASHSSGQYSFLNPAPPSVPSNPFATMVTTPSIGQYPFLNPVPPSVPSNPFSTTVTTPSLDAAQPLPAPYNPLISPNSLSNNLCSVPSTSVTQPVSIFGPNKSPFISSFPAITAPQYPSINNSSAGAASIDGLNYTTSFASSSYMSSTVTAPVTVSAPCIASLETASSPATFWPSQTSQTRGLSISGFDGFKGVGEQTTSTQQLPSQNTEIKQSPIADPFGTPYAVPQMLTEGTRIGPPVKYGISSIPVCDKPAPARGESLLNIRHLSYHRQRWLPLRKYKPKSDVPKVAFFDDAQRTPATAKKEDLLLPRSNPRAFISGLHEELNPRFNFNNTSFEKNTSTDTYENGISSETDAAEHDCNTDFIHSNHPIKNEISSNVYELMPKVKHSDYYFEPRVEELAIKESYEPGFCSHVKGFVVGRQGYGSIKFLEETDVRELDLESYIEFKNHEVIVYTDESMKPPIGQGLNKAAEITLCNIKVVDKKTGKQYVNGSYVDKLKEKLMKKTAEQGAEFVSYNPVQGEWKFRVQHF